MVDFGGFVEEFFEEAPGREFGPNAARSCAILEGEKDLVLADGVKTGEVASQPGLGKLIEALKAKAAGGGVQKLDRSRPAAGSFLGEAIIDGAGDAQEGLAVGLGDEAGTSGGEGGKVAWVQEFRS